jgi:hypothetical protein
VIKREASPRTCSHAVLVVTALADAIDLDGAQPSPAYHRNGNCTPHPFTLGGRALPYTIARPFCRYDAPQETSPDGKSRQAGNSSTAEQEITLLLIARGGDCFKQLYALPRHVVSQGR